MNDDLYQSLSIQDRVKYELAWWTITIVASVYIVPLVLLSVINPFWFRQDFTEMVQEQIRNLSTWRRDKLKPIFNKYREFEILRSKRL